MPSHVRIRPARAADAPILTEIAWESKRHWGYPDEWMALWRDALAISPDYLAGSIVHVAEIEGAAVAFYAIRAAGSGWELDHLWVRPEHIGQGIGRKLMRHASARLAKQAPGAALRIESEPHAEPFYLRMGARRVGESTREWGGLRRTLPLLEIQMEGRPVRRRGGPRSTGGA